MEGWINKADARDALKAEEEFVKWVAGAVSGGGKQGHSFTNSQQDAPEVAATVKVHDESTGESRYIVEPMQVAGHHARPW